MKQKVVIGLSGGVDSAVSAALLKEKGFEVIALFMKNWEEEGECPSSIDAQDVAKICDLLDIPFYTVNFVQEYRQRVFDRFLQELKEGLTPNPDILCNREIKFDLFLKKAQSLGADWIATGHYCQTDERGRLFKGLDPLKDQSYFLHSISYSALQKTLFPIGSMHKTEVKQKARDLGLSVAYKKESMGICFIGKKDFKSFIQNYLGYSPGPLKTLSGQKVGSHDGAAYYTLGQRHGLGLGGEGEPWYVVKKEIGTNTVYVERGHDHPELFAKTLVAQHPHWIESVPSFPLRCKAKTRYRQEESPCVVHLEENGALRVEFDLLQWAITPGQFVVFYDGSLCLGGAKIKHVASTHQSALPTPRS